MNYIGGKFFKISLQSKVVLRNDLHSLVQYIRFKNLGHNHKPNVTIRPHPTADGS